ncbi:MAG TPA: hypothetical protein VMZ29_01655 [Candidatus Bathyarchaeia archaeon]|nr:hypothetical protein [Candidatus Bathyarchaeia archaeon]
MNILYKVPLDLKDIAYFLEEEQNFLKGFLKQLEEVNTEKIDKKSVEVIQLLLNEMSSEVDIIYPMKSPHIQIQALITLANTFSKVFSKTKLEQLGIASKWILLNNGYLGSFVKEDYEIAILLYLIALVYQANALKNVQTSIQYRYFYISALAAIKGAILFMEKLAPAEEHYAYPFYQMLLLRKLEVEAEITKSEAFIARKQGNFDKAAKLFAGAAAFRFSMMNFDLPVGSDNRVKIYASSELGMACFYIAVGLSNMSEAEQSHYYLLKAKKYFENAAKLSENNTELLEAANKRLDLVNPYIDRIKDLVEKPTRNIDEIPDPQPLMIHPDPDALFFPKDNSTGAHLICSNCIKKIPWTDTCPKCGEKIVPIE